MIRILKARILKGVVTQHIESGRYEEMQSAGDELRSLVMKRFGRSLNIREVDTGSCGACESEIISANNPVYDLARFGVNFVASPRHADALLVTGPVSKNMLIALKKTYDAIPEPKFVITCGDCALNGGVFKDSYYVEGAVGKTVQVVLHIPGCPPSPLTIIRTLTAFLRNVIER